MKFLFLFALLFSFAPLFAQTVGSKVQMVGEDKKQYTGVVKEINGDQYKVKYDGYEFEAWLTSNQFTLAGNAKSNVSKGTIAYAQELTNIFNFGKTNGWTAAAQERLFEEYLAKMTATELQSMHRFFFQAATASARFFALESWLAGDDFTVLQNFINELNAVTETVQQEKCLITNYKSIIQQWQLSCSVTTVQTYLGDLSPRYAWEVKKVSNYDQVANDPQNPLAQQQKLLLENYGGVATPRGDNSGRSIGILEPLNQLVGPYVSARFYAEQIFGDLPAVFVKIREQLSNGFLVPLLINFEGSEGAHFIMIMRSRYNNGDHHYLIYDPWVGVCDYVSERNLLNGSLAPMDATHKISIGYFYPTVPLSKEERDALHESRKQKGF